MLKEHNYIFQRVNMAIDLGLTGLAVVAAHGLRNYVLAPYVAPGLFRDQARIGDYLWLLWTLPVLVIGALVYNGYYRSQRVRSFGEVLRIIIVSAIMATVLAMGIGFLLSGRAVRAVAAPATSAGASSIMVAPADLVLMPRPISGGSVAADSTERRTGAADNVSRGVLLLVPFLVTLFLGVKHLAARRVLIGLRERGYNYRTLLLVGSGETLRQFVELVQNHPFWGFRLAGIIDDGGNAGAKKVFGLPVVGGLGSLWSYLEHNVVDEVVFIPARRSLEELSPYFEGCEEMGVRTRLALNFFHHTIARPVLDTYEGVPVVSYSPTREMSTALLFKYAFDRVAAAVALVVLSPLFLVLAAIVKLTSQSWSDPIFYGQTRVGLNGRHFKVWKFRSMVVNADAMIDKLKGQNEMSGPVFKIKRDPRITPIGRFLRKSSLDELPQLWNVLVGDMSLVGPRPPIPSEVEQYDRWQRRRLSMKPGITCLWQVMGRNQLSFGTWMKLDLQYIDNWSLWLDLRILLRTVYVVATGHGAM